MGNGTLIFLFSARSIILCYLHSGSQQCDFCAFVTLLAQESGAEWYSEVVVLGVLDC
jgi:hypothetical protein